MERNLKVVVIQQKKINNSLKRKLHETRKSEEELQIDCDILQNALTAIPTK